MTCLEYNLPFQIHSTSRLNFTTVCAVPLRSFTTPGKLYDPFYVSPPSAPHTNIPLLQHLIYTYTTWFLCGASYRHVTDWSLLKTCFLFWNVYRKLKINWYTLRFIGLRRWCIHITIIILDIIHCPDFCLKRNVSETGFCGFMLNLIRSGGRDKLYLLGQTE
jgi:hypothetical protein